MAHPYKVAHEDQMRARLQATPGDPSDPVEITRRDLECLLEFIGELRLADDAWDAVKALAEEHGVRHGIICHPWNSFYTWGWSDAAQAGYQGEGNFETANKAWLDALRSLLAERTQANQKLKEVRLLVIGTRHYIKKHRVRIGECVAWDKLKKLFRVGQTKEEEALEFEEWEQSKP